MPFPFDSDVLLSIGPLALRWYGLAYVVGVVLGWLFLRRLVSDKNDPIGSQPLDTLFQAAVIGIIVGGRLFYVLIYNWGYYSQNLWEIVQIWRGGMSFHGGFLGMFAAVYFTAHKHRLRFLQLADIVVVVAPIGLFFGRIANFINCELYGKITDVPWGVVFNRGTCINPTLGLAPAGDFIRHPSQIYEALTEGLLLLVILVILLRLGARRQTGVLSAVFLLGYATARISVEYFREPDPQLGVLGFDLSMGQWLSLPMLVCGAGLLVWARRTSPSN
ncbi:MAG: prolipoprotein diacylglyceryl transferase [Proteobacteria bacterium]|nr:prolipoprotein diacylglyceryl transferase [Pseudomonadota bacterium]